MTNAENINARLDALTQRVNSLEMLTGTYGTSQVAIAQIYSRLDSFAEATNNNFSQITQRFERVEGRLENVEGRLENVEGRLENVEGRLENVERRLEVIELIQAQHTELLNEILRILRERNGGS
ncbi:MAG: hypothetical protein QNJ51_23375 [Calothrix sp. MO_167.B12]|nr:hypothetical protein [Calothrix sp. MO_167.B12]